MVEMGYLVYIYSSTVAMNNFKKCNELTSKNVKLAHIPLIYNVYFKVLADDRGFGLRVSTLQ